MMIRASSFQTRLWMVVASAACLWLLAWRSIASSGLHWDATSLAVGSSVVAFLSLASWSLRWRRTFTEGVLILGTSPMAVKLIDEIEARPDGRFRLIGAVDDSPNGNRAFGVTPLLGRLDQFSQIVAATRPARIVIAMADRRGRVPESALLESRFRGVRVEDAVDFFEGVTGKLAIESIRPSSLILSEGFKHSDLMRSRIPPILRRCANLLCAASGLALSAPLLVLISILIKLDSSGPVFFVQNRVGRAGKPFGLIKFRTMRDGDATRVSEWVSDNTARITRVGRWLRRFRLDEVPQLLNVVRGEMNLVGPRPHPVSNYQLFLDNIPYYGYRSLVRPGLTGWAQVRYGYANDLEEETEKMRYDFYYIKHRTIGLDIRILVETLGVLFFDRRSHEAARRIQMALPSGEEDLRVA